jgi:glycosyltransferase involved in cell wall biosynthesis
VTPETRAQARILYVTDGFAPFVIGGMQSYARRQLETLAAAGYELISITPDGAAAPTEPLAWRNVALPWPQRSALGRLSPWRYANDLKRFSTAVAEAADRVQPHIIYSEGPLLHAYLHRKSRPARTIFNPHGLEMFQDKGSRGENIKAWPLRGIVADHARRADIAVCLSERGQLQRILRAKIGVGASHIAVLPNAAPAAEAVEHGRGTGPTRFLFVGRDEPRKALPLLLDAFGEIDGAELDLVGVECAAPAHVTAHGAIRDRARVARFYREADFLVAPSHAEGMPTVVLEAFAAGLPVIATDVGANADLVRDGETGFLIPRNDRAALADAMRRATQLPPADYAAISANCLAVARDRFSADAARDRLLSLLDGLLKLDKSA